MIACLAAALAVGPALADKPRRIPIPVPVPVPVPRRQAATPQAPDPAPPDRLTVQVRGMEAELRATPRGLEVRMEAQTTGWMVVGFSPDGGMPGADLRFVRWVEGRAVYADHFVQSHGEHYPDAQVGGGPDGVLVTAYEGQGRTTATLRLPWTDSMNREATDQPLVPGQPAYVVLAWSTSDDLDHHSAVRQTQRVVLPVPPVR